MTQQRIRHVRYDVPSHNLSFALLSGADTSLIKRAVIFVHGFNGSARTTWTDFIGLVDNAQAASPWWEAVDLYFFDYQRQSVFQQISRNTISLMNFIDDVWPSPQVEMAPALSDLNRTDFVYDEITLVGHSEGGLLIRKVILETARHNDDIESFRLIHDKTNQAEPSPDGLLKADLRLFAPAIAGEALSGLWGIIASLPIIRNVTRGSAAKQGLASESVSVSSARKATDDYTEYLTMTCFRAHILWADDDAIVMSEPYQRDRACRNLPPGTDHVSICKPSWKYLLPVDFIEKGVVNGKC